MANLKRFFTKGRMNKSSDERIIPNGEYIDAMNVRLASTEEDDVGSIENTKGNIPLVELQYIDNTPLSDEAKCIGAYQDSARETIYWFVHDPAFTVGATGKLDLVVSFNVKTSSLTYHVVSIDDGSNVNTTLNFSKTYIITGVDMVEDLLFWTDDNNEPRFININRSYPVPIGNIDDANLAESLLVIKRPPINSPGVEPVITGGDQNYMEDRMICFAYRYRYSDDDYSATSLWSEPSFIPNSFDFSLDSALNEGMQNKSNAAIITFNSGGPLVKGIDVLFKEADSEVIRVIERIDKQEEGFLDDTNYTLVFDNSKVFSLLNSSEIFRLYDNVPLKAKAQTIMGNRLMYGNYVEGRDLVDLNGNDVRIEYEADLSSNFIGLEDLSLQTGPGDYTIGGLSNTINGSIIYIEFDDISLLEGSAISIEFTINHSQFDSSGSPFPVEVTENVSLTFDYILPQTFSSVYDLATSQDFLDKIGTVSNIKTVQNACSGTTLTDRFNCAIPQNLDAYEKFQSGITANDQPIKVIATPGDTIVGLQFPAMSFVDDLFSPTETVYEYYTVTLVEGYFQLIATPKSLHSNRAYEVGIIYMDEFGRSTDVLTSEDNIVRVPCDASDKQNQIKVTIPITQVAPSWATRYKLALRPDKEGYDTIFSNIFFEDPDSNDVYFLVDGENASKVNTGDRLVVKKDTSGIPEICTYATVLEKSTEAEGFLEIPSEQDPSVNVYVPAGAYLRIRPNDFAAVMPENAIVSYGQKVVNQDEPGEFPILSYPVHVDIGGTLYNYDIPAGSVIDIDFEFVRLGVGEGNGACEQRQYRLTRKFISTANYNNFKEWWDSDDIETQLNSGQQTVGLGGCPIDNQYDNTLLQASAGQTINDIDTDLCTNHYQFFENADGGLELVVSGTRRCNGWFAGKSRRSSVSVKIDVFRADTLMVFETEPSDALPDIFFESSESFAIETTTGEHQGNVINQNFIAGIAAVINTSFFNCYAFGNGVESYKIRDSISGRFFRLGNRASATADQDYRRIRRFADITYSGIYNNETNINRLNEFNLGLSNFKNCEISFGDIQILDGRKTDVLVLQEDKISYVLAGKNLLSDATGGGNVTSVPEVLGTQVSRPEEYGISSNPESYVKWGYDKFFTDSKRGAVLQLRGSAGSNEQLLVISDSGMRSWFRDLFIDSFNTQKLGAYDPYMDEYVLSSNDEIIPQEIECIDCGTTQTISLIADTPVEYCVDLGNGIGDVTVYYTILEIDPEISISVTADYDGTETTSGNVSTSGSFTLSKGTVNPNDIDISIVSNGGNAIVEILVDCPQSSELTVVEVCITSNQDAGKYIHNEYRWAQGTYYSSLQSALVTFQSGVNPVVSRYLALSGLQGTGAFPPDGSTVNMYVRKIGFDDFDFDPNLNKLRFLRSSTLYGNNPADIQALVAASTSVFPIGGSPGLYFGDFTMPSNGSPYLYLIWDYRSPNQEELCYSDVSIEDVCCECGDCPCSTYELVSAGGATFAYTDCSGNSQTISVTGTQTVCAKFLPTVTVGEGAANFVECGCPTQLWLIEHCITGQQIIASGSSTLLIGEIVRIDTTPECLYQIIDAAIGSPVATITGTEPTLTCADACGTYSVTNNTGATQTLLYVDCNSQSQSVEIANGQEVFVCALSFENGGLFNIAFVECGCNLPEIYLLVRKCVTNQEISVDPASSGAIVGDFVRLVGDTDCLWEVIDTSAVIPTQAIDTVDNSVDCGTVCKTWQISSTDASDVTVNYIACDGQSLSVVVSPLTTVYVCAQSVTQPAGEITITYFNCGCNLPENNWLIRRCGELTFRVASSAFLLSIGDFVVIDGEPECLYQVIDTSSAFPNANVASVSDQTCADVCSTWRVVNSSGSTQTISYTDCSGVAQTQDILNGHTYYICARSVAANENLTTTWFACGCNPADFSFLLQRCGDGTQVYAFDSGAYVVGQFVVINGEPECTYEIISTSTEFPTATITSLAATQSCIGLCTTYELFNPTGSTIAVPYQDCNGSGASISVPAGQTVYVCAEEINAPAVGVQQTWYECGCNPPSTNFLVRRCGDALEKSVVDTGLGVQVGDFVQIGAERDCVYEVIGTTTDPFVDTINAIYPFQSCDDACGTYSIENPTGGALSITYTDCNDLSQTLSIPAGETWQICAKTIETIAAGLVETWVDCGCNPTNFTVQLQRCGDGQIVIAYNAVDAQVGNFVTLDGIADCIYQVVSLSNQPPTETILTIEDVAACSEVCSTWYITNNTGSNVTVNYTDCSGVAQTETLLANGELYLCARSVASNANYTVAWYACGCNIPNYTYDIQFCGSGTTAVASANVSVNIGDIVNAGDPDCKAEVIALSAQPPTTIITSNTQLQSCDDVCSTWEIVNPARTIQTLSYVDCDGVAQTADIGLEQTWYVCARTVDVGATTLTATWYACGCNPPAFSLQVDRCGDGQTEIIYDDGTLNIGDFVGANDCVYEVVDTSIELPTMTPTSTALVASCDEVCSTWVVENSTANTVVVNFINCEGAADAIELAGGIGLQAYICARSVSASPDYSVGWHACGCNIPQYSYLLQQCTALEGGLTVIGYDLIGTIQIGDLVFLDGLGECRFEVISTSNQVPDRAITSFAPEESCDSVCQTYQVDYASGTGTFTYVNCSGVQQTINVPDDAIGVQVCLYSIVNSTEVTVTLIDCGCEG